MSDLARHTLFRNLLARGTLRNILAGLLPALVMVGIFFSLPLKEAGAAAAADKKPAAHKVDPRSKDPGERAFQANCSRCHNPPDALSPRVTGTVLRHMRVRANLSAEDERLILGYLNP